MSRPYSGRHMLITTVQAKEAPSAPNKESGAEEDKRAGFRDGSGTGVGNCEYGLCQIIRTSDVNARMVERGRKIRYVGKVNNTDELWNRDIWSR